MFAVGEKTSVPAVQESGTQHWISIDTLKGIGILTVIWIHCFHIFGLPPAKLELISGFATRFAVPGFLFASGFLAQRSHHVPLKGFVYRRLQRLLPPYVVATFLTWAYHRTRGLGWPAPGTAMYQLVTASAWGPYYFVFVLLGAVLVLPPLFRGLPQLGPIVFVILWLVGAAKEMHVGPAWSLFWEYRDPLRWWGYFAAGWLVSSHAGWFHARGQSVARKITATLVVFWLILFSIRVATLPERGSPTLGAITYLAIYAAVLALFFMDVPSQAKPVIEFLSRVSYPVYLYHLFFVESFRQMLGPPTRVNRVLTFAFAVPTTFLFVTLGRRVLRNRAKFWLG